MTNEELRIRVLLATQTALLGAISANIRAVICNWTDEHIGIRAIFDHEITEIDSESMSEVETEVMSHFPEHNVTVECCRVDMPSLINARTDEIFVFRRREV